MPNYAENVYWACGRSVLYAILKKINRGVILMELRVLRYFLTVAQEENISHAADILHVTQPNLMKKSLSSRTGNVPAREDNLGSVPYKLCVSGRNPLFICDISLRAHMQIILFPQLGDFSHHGGGVMPVNRCLILPNVDQ